MPSIYTLKSRFQDLLRPSVKALFKMGVTANQVTVAAFVLSALVGACLYFVPFRLILLLVPVFLFVRMALNAIDGMLAREHQQKSDLGAILNEMGDVFADAVIYVPLMLVTGVGFWLLVLTLVLSIASEMLGVVGVQIGASRRYDGPMGKSDRAFLFSALALVFMFYPDVRISMLVMGGMDLLLVFTLLNRAKGALKEAGNK